ncbi:hypothetical protein ABID59_003482 [Bradyrhizobium sp. S3.3.6]
MCEQWTSGVHRTGFVALTAMACSSTRFRRPLSSKDVLGEGM